MLLLILFIYDINEGKYMYIQVSLLYIMLLYCCMQSHNKTTLEIDDYKV